MKSIRFNFETLLIPLSSSSWRSLVSGSGRNAKSHAYSVDRWDSAAADGTRQMGRSSTPQPVVCFSWGVAPAVQCLQDGFLIPGTRPNTSHQELGPQIESGTFLETLILMSVMSGHYMPVNESFNGVMSVMLGTVFVKGGRNSLSRGPLGIRPSTPRWRE